MPAVNQQNIAVNEIITEPSQFESSKLPSESTLTLVGEHEHENSINVNVNTHTLKIGEPSDTECECEESENENEQHEHEQHEHDEEAIDAKYMKIVMDNIGSYTAFNKLYRHTNDIIGTGTQSIVYKGTNLSDNKPVAIQQTTLPTTTQFICWFAKYLIIKQCNLYTLYDAYLYPTSTSTQTNSPYKVILVQPLFTQNITEIMTENALNSDCDNNMSEAEVRKMVFQIVTQLNILHKQHNYIHNDIKPTNIMQHSNGDYTLIDFGFAMQCNSIFSGYIGTKEWSAPEIKPYQNAQNMVYQSNDMWGIALVIIYCLFNGTHPFCHSSLKKRSRNSLRYIQKWYQKKIQNKQCSIESWLGKQLITNKISYNLFDFLFKCLRFDPNKRLTPKLAIKHKWLANIANIQ